MLTVQLDWKPNAQFAGLILAIHNGWFADQNVDVRILPWQPATDPVKNLSSEVGLIAVSEDNLAIQSAFSGEKIKLLGSMLQRSPLAWMVLKDSNIKEFADFRSKKIGVHKDGITGLQFAMKSVGLELSSADVIDVTYEKMEQLKNGEIDICQCNGLVEPLEMEHSGTPVRVFWAWDTGYSVYSQVLSTSDATLQKYGREVSVFMSVLWEGWRKVYESTSSISKIIVDNFLFETDSDVQNDILKVMKPFVFGYEGAENTNEIAVGGISLDRLQKSIDLLVRNAVITDGLKAADILWDRAASR